MSVLIKDLAEKYVGATFRSPGVSDGSLFSDLPQIFSQLLPSRNFGTALRVFSVFFLPKNCTIMQFFPESAPNMHYSACSLLFDTTPRASFPPTYCHYGTPCTSV